MRDGQDSPIFQCEEEEENFSCAGSTVNKHQLVPTHGGTSAQASNTTKQYVCFWQQHCIEYVTATLTGTFMPVS